MDCPHRPRYCFGHGLSYTRYEYSGLTLARKETKPFEAVSISLKVKNAGNCAGTEIVQLYVRRPSDAQGPLKTLRGFLRVQIPAGETAEVTFALTPDTFLAWDEARQDMLPQDGEWELLYGGSSDNLQTLKYVR